MTGSHGPRDLAIAAVVIIGLSRFVDDPAAWLLAPLTLVAVGLGTLQVVGEDGGPVESAGVPIETLAVPALVAGAGVGVIRLVPVGPWLIPAVAVLGWFVARATATELRIARSTVGASGADRTVIIATTLLTSFLGFVGVAALVPGGLPEPGATVSDTEPAIVALALADAVVAMIAGYRVAAVRTPNARDAGWFAVTAGLTVAATAAGLRVLEIPRLLGPALLTAVLFLWDALHGRPAARRRDATWLWETGLLAVLAIVAVAWSLGART